MADKVSYKTVILGAHTTLAEALEHGGKIEASEVRVVGVQVGLEGAPVAYFPVATQHRCPCCERSLKEFPS